MVTKEDLKKFIGMAPLRLPAGIIAGSLIDEIDRLDPDIKEILSCDEVPAVLFNKLIDHVLTSAQLDDREHRWSRKVGIFDYVFFYRSECMISINVHLSYDMQEDITYSIYCGDNNNDPNKTTEEI